MGHQPKSLWQSRQSTPAFFRPSACFGVAFTLVPLLGTVMVGAMNSSPASEASNSMFHYSGLSAHRTRPPRP